jgi:site-specific recombinase XerC
LILPESSATGRIRCTAGLGGFGLDFFSQPDEAIGDCPGSRAVAEQAHVLSLNPTEMVNQSMLGLVADEHAMDLVDLAMKPLMASLLYSSGLRLIECLRLRVKDIDFGQNHLVVRDGKGQKDRVTLLPRSLIEALTSQIGGVRRGTSSHSAGPVADRRRLVLSSWIDPAGLA